MNAKLEQAIRALAEAQRQRDNANTAADQLAEHGGRTQEEQSAIISAAFDADNKREKAIVDLFLAFAEDAS